MRSWLGQQMTATVVDDEGAAKIALESPDRGMENAALVASMRP